MTVERRSEETVEYLGNNKIARPSAFEDASRVVVRTPWNTVVYTEQTMTYYNSENNHLEPGEASFKRWGGEEVIYRVEGYPDDHPAANEGEEAAQ